MHSLLHIAARIEAAVASYVSVRHVADRAEWERRFEAEKALTTREFRRVWRDSGDSPALHPTLAALYFVLDTKGDLSEIGRGHPKINKHKFYQPGAEFPADISHLLPPSERRWWEHLAAECGDGGVPPGTAAPNPTPPPPPPPPSPPPPSPPRRHLPKVTLIMGPPPSSPPPPPPEDWEDDMEVDELEESPKPPPSRKKGKKAAGSAATLRKRKLPSLPTRSYKKRNLPSFQLPPEVIEDELESEEEEEEFEFSCDKCIKANVRCEPQPTAPCLRCQSSKVGCSLMPPNSKTGKTDRRHLDPEAVLRYRIAQHKARKGKQPASAYRKTSEASDSAGSASRLVEGLALYSTSSNAASQASLAPTAAGSPISPDPSASDAAAATAPTTAAGPSAPAAAADAADATPAITPSLRRRLPPAQRLVPVVEVPLPSHLASSSSRQRSEASAAQAPQAVPDRNTAERIRHLEMRMADVEEKLELWVKGGGARKAD